MAKKSTEEIIDLIEIVEEEESEVGDDFLNPVDKEDFFDEVTSPASSPPPPQHEEDEVEKFFKPDLPGEESTALPVESPSRASIPEDDEDDKFESFLGSIEEELQPSERDHSSGIKEQVEKKEDFSALEKQWEQAFIEAPEAEDTFGGDNGLSIIGDEPLPAKIKTRPPEQPTEQSILEERFASVLPVQNFSEEKLEAMVEKTLRQILEPVAERVFAEVAEKIITREITQLKNDIATLENENT
jgi:hypothetical protein